MSSNSDERFYKRKLNEFEQELKRLQKELAKLKVLKREGGRARKQLLRSMQREMDLQSMFEDNQAEQFADMHREEPKKQTYCCKECDSGSVDVVPAGLRKIIVCLDCRSRYTVLNEDALVKTA